LEKKPPRRQKVGPEPNALYLSAIQFNYTCRYWKKQLVVKDLPSKGAGKGLFTQKDIIKDTKIVEYKGKITKWKEVDDRKGMNGLYLYVTRDHVIDAWFDKKALARYANDAKGLVRTEGFRNNCTYRIEGLRVFIYAMRNIPPEANSSSAMARNIGTFIKENWGVK